MTRRPVSPNSGPHRRSRCSTRRVLRVLRTGVFIFLALLLVGLLPVNNDFTPSPDGVEIFILSTPIHSDVVLPIEAAEIDWRRYLPADCFAGDTGFATHVAIGWGEKNFYMETPTWADLRISTAAKALLWPSECCLHVAYRTTRHFGSNTRSVRISAEQYHRLVRYLRDSFRTDDSGHLLPIADAAYGKYDAFFEARGTYHAFYTCNSWLGDALQAAGVRTAWFTPLPGTPMLYLP